MASAQGNAGVATWGPGRQTSSLQYFAPEVNGFKAQVAFNAEDSDNKVNYAIGVTYTAGPLSAAVTAETARFGALGYVPAANSFSSIAASYDFKVDKVMIGYADGSNIETTSGLNVVYKGATIGVVAPIAGYNVDLNYSKNSESTAAATELFVNREVYKNTYGYADIGHAEANGTKATAYAIGVIYTF